MVAHDELMKKENAVFNYERSELRSFAIPKGMSSWSVEQLFAHQIPKEMLVTFVDNDAYLGEFKSNPFNYQNFGLQYLSYSAEGIESKVFEPNYTEGRYTKEYMALYESAVGRHMGGIIRLADYAEGYAVYRVIITPAVQYSKIGQSRLAMKFGA